MFYVYLITNRVNGKLYVGKTTNVAQRWKQHKNIASRSTNRSGIYSAILKYGVENFQIETLKEYETEQLALDGEMNYISKLKSEGLHLYNLTDGGEGASGFKHSIETKQKLSSLLMGNTHRRGTQTSEAGIENIRRSKLGRGLGEENSFYGKHHSDETKTKLALANKNNRPRAKLAWSDVILIRDSLITNQFTPKELADKFGVSRDTISDIRRNKTWKT